MAGLSKQLLLTFLRNKLIFMICFSILVIGIVMMWDLPKKFPNVVGLIYICVWNYIAYTSVRDTNEYRLFVIVNGAYPLEPYSSSKALAPLLVDVSVNAMIILAVAWTFVF